MYMNERLSHRPHELEKLPNCAGFLLDWTFEQHQVAQMKSLAPANALQYPISCSQCHTLAEPSHIKRFRQIDDAHSSSTFHVSSVSACTSGSAVMAFGLWGPSGLCSPFKGSRTFRSSSLVSSFRQACIGFGPKSRCLGTAYKELTFVQVCADKRMDITIFASVAEPQCTGISTLTAYYIQVWNHISSIRGRFQHHLSCKKPTPKTKARIEQ